MRRKIDVTIPNLLKKGDALKNEPFEDARKKRENVENRLFIVVLRRKNVSTQIYNRSKDKERY